MNNFPRTILKLSQFFVFIKKVYFLFYKLLLHKYLKLSIRVSKQSKYHVIHDKFSIKFF